MMKYVCVCVSVWLYMSIYLSVCLSVRPSTEHVIWWTQSWQRSLLRATVVHMELVLYLCFQIHLSVDLCDLTSQYIYRVIKKVPAYFKQYNFLNFQSTKKVKTSLWSKLSWKFVNYKLIYYSQMHMETKANKQVVIALVIDDVTSLLTFSHRILNSGQ